MSYIRVIPRDLFNEANLLKCHGQLVIHLEGRLPNAGFPEDVSRFEVEQDPNSGAIYIESSYKATIRRYGEAKSYEQID